LVSRPAQPTQAQLLDSIPEPFFVDERTYGNTRGRYGRAFIEYFPRKLELMRDR